MSLKWNKDAEEAIRKVPFFVRKRVRKRVEEEARERGASLVVMEHVTACRQRFLHHMEDEVRGYQVETCFGPSGCPNRACVADDLPGRIEDRLAKSGHRDFLEKVVPGKLKMHHEFRVSCSDCPNACSRPQIADIGVVGACRPNLTDEECTECGACVEICREDAVEIVDGHPVIDWEKCVDCGQCVGVCPTDTLVEGEKGFRVLVGGKLGRHPRLARELPGIHGEEVVVRIVEACLEHYRKHCREGERFGEILERTGRKAFERRLTEECN